MTVIDRHLALGLYDHNALQSQTTKRCSLFLDQKVCWASWFGAEKGGHTSSWGSLLEKVSLLFKPLRHETATVRSGQDTKLVVCRLVETRSLRRNLLLWRDVDGR